MFNLFRRSVDSDGPMKQLLLEELLVEQLKWYAEGEGCADRGWMGYPWCMNLMRLRLKADGMKASDPLLSAIVNAASVLAVETQQRRDRELAEAKTRPLASIPSADQRIAGVCLLLDSYEATSEVRRQDIPVPKRVEILRHVNEACHALKCFMAAPDGPTRLSDESIDRLLKSLTEPDRVSIQMDARQFIISKTSRPAQYRFDNLLPEAF